MLPRLPIALCCALAGCATADSQPELLVTLNSISVTSVDSGDSTLDVSGVVTADVNGLHRVTLFDHDDDNPLAMDSYSVYPASGVVAKHTIAIPVGETDPPYEIVLHYVARGTVYETLAIPYVDGMDDRFGFTAHAGGRVQFQLTLREL